MTLNQLFNKSPNRVKSRLTSFVDIHDPHTLEINSSFDLGKDALRGETELVLFFPKSLKLSEIPKSALASDFQIRMRLSNRGREKKIKLNVDAMLEQIEKLLPDDANSESPQPDDLKKLCKKLGIIMGDWMTSHQTSLRKKLAQFTDHPSAEDLGKVIFSGTRGLESFDSIILKVRNYCERMGEEQISTLHLLHQYLSQRYLLYLDTLTIAVTEILRLAEPFSPFLLKPVYDVKEKIDGIKYREARDPRSPLLLESSRGDQKILEERLIMLGYLKKFFQSEAFIEMKEKTQKERVFETISIFAAGLAGLFAALAGLVLMNQEKIRKSPENFFESLKFIDIGNLAAQSTSFLLIFGTVSYIFRDRIKEQSKRYLQRRLSNVLPDYHADLRLKSKSLGEMKSWLQVNPERGLPLDVAQLRSASCLIEAEKFVAEDIVYLKRIFQLDGAANVKREPKQSLHDIVRFNVHRTLRFMDAPIKPISVLREDGTIEKTFTSRNYLIYLVVESRIRNSNGDALMVESKKVFRIIVNKEGIQRLELVKKWKQKNMATLQNKKLTFLSPLL